MKRKCSYSHKAIFDSRRKCEDFALSVETIHNRTGVLRTYYCEWCNGYHLTSSPTAQETPTHLKHRNDFKKYLQ